MKRVLVLACQSQTGQLAQVVASVTGPLRSDPAIELDTVTLATRVPYPFPWPFMQFFNTFPETVREHPVELQPVALPGNLDYDLIILAYQVWFLSPPPVLSSFLRSAEATRLLNGRPVITVIACRNMWLMAQEIVRERLRGLGARLIDNVVLVDQAHSAATFIATPMWLLTGRRGPFLGGLVPAAGLTDQQIRAASRFGRAIRTGLPGLDPRQPQPLLTGLAAVQINDRLIASEAFARRSFRLWSRLLMALGGPQAPLRRLTLCLYIAFLVTMILTVIPVSAVVKRVIGIFTRNRIAQQHAYYSAPSGEDRGRMDQFSRD